MNAEFYATGRIMKLQEGNMFIWNAKKIQENVIKLLYFFFKVLLLEFSVFGCIIKVTRKIVFPVGRQKKTGELY